MLHFNSEEKMESNSLKKIGISLRIVKAQNYPEKRDALSHDWPPFFEKINAMPIFIPNTLSNVRKFLEYWKLDGLLLSGGENIGDNIERDETEKEILNFGIENHIPIFGVCRGMQFINKFFGGSILTTSNQNHVGKFHKVEIILPKISTLLSSQSIEVNSYHNNTITNDLLANDLKAFAICNDDKTIEGFIHKNYPIIAVMWHPERNPDKNNELLLRNIFHEKLNE